jgi:HK97 family phage major capsid protein
MPTAKELREKHATLVANARELLEQHGDDNGNMPADVQAQYDKMIDDACEQAKSAKRIESLEKLEKDLQQPVGAPPPIDPAAMASSGQPATPRTISVRAGLGRDGRPRYIDVPPGPRGTAEYHDAYVGALNRDYRTLPADRLAALQSDDADQAGYLVASEEFATGLLRAVDNLLFIRRYATVHTVRGADSLGIRKRTAGASTFDWSSELAVSTEDSSLTFGKKVLTPHHLTGMIKVSRDLVRRSVIPAEQLIRDELAINAAEKEEQGFLTGTGAQQPLGVFTASADGISTGRDVDSGSTTSITADALQNVKYTLKSQYRTGGDRAGVRWMFHRDGVKIISKLKDANNQYLFIAQPYGGLLGDEAASLLGYPVDESENCPNTFTAALYVGLLANWRYYEIADSLDLETQFLQELYAATNQFGLILRAKVDGLATLEEAFVRVKTNAS